MKHSSLGGSSTSRFIACPGSPRLIASLPRVDDPLLEDWTSEGLTAHDIAARALSSGQDAWEFAGELDPEGLIAVQVYLDHVRSIAIPEATQEIECPVSLLDLHPLLYGTADYTQYIETAALLDIIDYKHGVGVSVSVVQNAQLKYYAFCKLKDYPDCRRVRMTVVQPRGFHPEGAVRTWECSAEEILEWGMMVLLPAMRATETSDVRNPGSHCQFCPAKLVCPEAVAQFEGLVKTEVTEISTISDERLSNLFASIPVAMFVKKALENEMLRRQLLGHKFSAAKLVLAKTDRVWKEGADKIFPERFGDAAYNAPSMKSPAQMEKVAGAKDLVKSWAFTPQRSMVSAQMDDKRHAVEPPSAADVFQQYSASDGEDQ